MALVIVIILALAFDFINGFHDSANAIATVVSTKSLSPRAAIIMAAVLNLAGALVSTGVARAFARGVVRPDEITLDLLMGGLVGAIAWNLATWYFGIPSSSSHALVGGLAGAALVGPGPAGINLPGFVKMVLSLFISPVIGFVAGLALMLWLLPMLERAAGKKGIFARLQLLSAAAVAFSHGSNDAQKAMGIIAAALYALGVTSRIQVPWWVVVAAALAMGAGTSTGGWRIIQTMGDKITRLTPADGFAAETAAVAVIGTATLLRLPVSTTHIVSSAIAAVGLRRGAGAVHWEVLKSIGWAMLLTLPASGAVGAAAGWVLGRLLR
ncbi:MAG TPA: inorganic phosphate transporter [Symbiobacteriaceae bacterium]|nr:inorganic phosphate transporter [Symbiobacteriaceae bacterium]